jgi:phosphate/sulfate permease
MGGMFAALLATALFLLLATLTRMPVSTTHAIVGGVVGMTVVGRASALPGVRVGAFLHHVLLQSHHQLMAAESDNPCNPI